jgi:hypothetical protein
MELFKSPRFLGVVAIGVLQSLVLFNMINSTQGEGLTLILQGIIAAAVVVRTVDRVADKTVESAQITAGIVPAETGTPYDIM